jgi:replicative DNA helicase
LERAGGPGNLTELYTYAPSPGHFRHHLQLIRDKFILRRQIEVCNIGIQSAYDSPGEALETLDELERGVLSIRECCEATAPQETLKQAAEEFLENLQKQIEGKGTETGGLTTGFEELDRMSQGGMKPGDMFVVAARPSMGKTAFTLNVSSHVATKLRKPVMFFSLEMGAEQLVQRLLGAEARIDLSNLRRGIVKDAEWAMLAEASGRLSDAALFIDETPSISVTEMRNKCRRQAHETGLSLVVVDYLQLMTGPPSDNKATEVGEISKGLKTLARELNIPVIALSQLNRGVESRTDKRPMMSDLRESGAIEQDADIIAFLDREEYYQKDMTPEDKLGIAEVIIAKHRNGPVGSVELRFFNNIPRFENLERDDGGYAP